MNKNEKKAASILLARMASILDIAEEMSEKILTEMTEPKENKSVKTATLLGDLIKLIQLLEKQYSLLRTVEKEQIDNQETPQADEQVIRNYLNKKHSKESKAEKTLRKGKGKHV